MTVNEITKGCFIKIATMRYLVDKLVLIDNKYFLEAIFAISTRKNSKLHHIYLRQNPLYKYCIENRVHLMNDDEKEKFINIILKEYPYFDFKTFSNKDNKFSEKGCVEYLKNKGYLVYKQQ